jgi:hypothetical protein
MTTKKDIDTLRVKRDAALADLKLANERRDAALAANSAAQLAYNELGRERKPEDRLASVVAQIAAIEADDAASLAARLAAAAEDAFDVATGDELAVACDPASIRTALTEDMAEIGRLRAQIAAIEERAAGRGEVALKAWRALAEQRAAAGRPAPPRPLQDTSAIGLRLTVEALLQNLDARLASAVTWTANGVLPSLRSEEMQLRASIERARREAEANARAKAKHEREQRALAARLDANERAERERASEEAKAEARELEAMAAAHKARTGT